MSLFWQNAFFSYLNTTSYFKPLMHGQINLIKFIESNKFDNVYSKIWHVFVWSNQLDQILKKIGRVLFHQINLMKKSQSKLKSHVWRKNCENKTANEWTWNIYSCKQQFITLNCTAWVYSLKTQSKIKCRSNQWRCSIKSRS